MATVGKVGYWIYLRLMAKPRRIYLVAMWILCGELRELYAPWRSAGEEPLMTSTMDLVREVVIDGETEETAARGLELSEAWEAFRRAHWAEAPGGLVNTWATFAGLAAEIGGIAGEGAGAQWVINAAEARWRDWNQPGPIFVNWEHAQELVESSPLGQTFEAFYRVVTRVSRLVSPEWDPARIRDELFPERKADYHAQDLADIALCEAIKAKNEPGMPHDKFMADLETENPASPRMSPSAEA